MKFFHLSDLHLGKHLHHYNLKDDQVLILKEIVEYARQIHPDAVLIAGDIYDKSVPSAEAVSIFDDFLTELSEIEPQIPILIISGNHDSGERLEFASQILHRNSIYIAGKPPVSEEEHLEEVTLEDEYGKVHFYLLPFMKPSYVRGLFSGDEVNDYSTAVQKVIAREDVDYKERNVLVSHQFYTGNGEIPETCDSELVHVGGLDNVDISGVKDFDYVALGHIHGSQQVGMPHIRYCGTPLKYSVSEASHEKGLLVVTLGDKGREPEMEKLPLHPAHDVRRVSGFLADILEQGRSGGADDYISVTLTDEEALYKPREQLLQVYPLLLEVRLDNARTRRRLEALDDVIEIRNPLEMYSDFYCEVHGSALPDEGREALEDLLEDLKEE